MTPDELARHRGMPLPVPQPTQASRFARDLRFFLEHFDVPDRMHCRAFWADDDGLAASYDGSPAWTRRFAHWLDESASATVTEVVEVECFHVGRRPGTICEVCAIRDADQVPIAESGIRRSERSRYRSPMRAALARLGGHTPRAGFPPHSAVLVALAYARGDIRAAASVLVRRWPLMGDDATSVHAFADALNRLRQAWHEEPSYSFRPAAAGEDAA